MSLITSAQTYKSLGLSIVPTDNFKRALIAWTPFQKEIISDEDINRHFPKAKGIAIICGLVSGGLEVIDIDTKHDTTGTLYEDYVQAIMDSNEHLVSKLVIARTRSGGYHMIYRCKEIEGNQKLARRMATEEELVNNPNEKVLVVIETRGEKGYICAAPSEGYSFIQGTAEDIPTITPGERDVLLTAARSLNTYIEAPVIVHPMERGGDRSFLKSPFEDYNERGDVVALLQEHGWTVVKDNGVKCVFKRPGRSDSKSSGDYNRDLGLFSVFTTSTEFEANKGYKPYAVYAVLKCGSNYKKTYQDLLEAGYGEKLTPRIKQMNADISIMIGKGVKESDIIDAISDKYGPDLDVIEHMLESADKDAILTFWDIKAKNKEISVVINRNRLITFLEDGGFYLYFYDKKTNVFRIIRDSNGILEEASTEQMKKYVYDYIDTLPATFDGISKEALKESLLMGSSHFFSDTLMEFMKRKDPDLLRDDADSAYFPFKNGIISINKDDVSLKTYGELGKSVWRAQVIDYNIDIADTDDLERVDFYRFLCKICDDSADKIKYALSLIGYLCHNYKDPISPFAVILGEESEKSDGGGGTGKGIFVTAINHMINAQVIDGKNFKLDKSFAFQRVDLGTKLIAIQDIRKNVDFEGFYSIITEGITIERKNKDEIYIPYCDSPKILFTTNYTIDNSSNHAARRQRLLEFGDFFSPDNTPIDFFKHRLFSDWDEHQWSLFYNFMFACVQLYLQSGVADYEGSDSGKNKKIRLQFTDEFHDWWVDYSSNGCHLKKFFGDVYESFLHSAELDSKEYSKKRFKKGLEIASKTYGYTLHSEVNRQASGRHEVWVEK